LTASRNKTTFFKVKALPIALASALSAVPAAYANPTSPTVVNGTVSMSTVGNTLTVTNTPGSIIHWQQFSINAGETTRFIQQGATSSVLNRVTGGSASQIMGALQSNGRVFIINPAGIVFGSSAVVNVAGLVASSLNISDQDFLSGKMKFAAESATLGDVTNAGNITTPNGGFVYIVAPKVENTGVITTPSGEAVLAAGHSVELVDSADPNLRVVVNATTSDVNLSQIMTGSNGDIYQVLNSGKISANTAVVGENGRVYLKSAGNIETTALSVIEARGDAAADGGRIIAFADHDGVYAGSFDASGRNGGFIETSGHTLDFSGVSVAAGALAPEGMAGTWLLDPGELTIDASAASSISSSLSAGTNVFLTTTAVGCSGPGNCVSTGNGNITFDGVNITSASSSYGGTTLTVWAYGDIVFQNTNTFSGQNASGPFALYLDTAYGGGPGTQIINTGSLTIDGTTSSAVVQVEGTQTWVNQGLLTLSGNSQIDLKVGGTSTFNNTSSGIVNIANNTSGWAFFSDNITQDGIINNDGIFSIVGGTSFEALFNNGSTGTTSISGGTLSMQNAGVLSGQIFIDSGATLWLSESHNGQKKFDSAIIVNNGGTLTSSVAYTFNNSTLATPGDLVMPTGSVTYSGSNSFIAGGSINFTNKTLAFGNSSAFFFAQGPINVSNSTLTSNFDLELASQSGISISNGSFLNAAWVGLQTSNNPTAVDDYVDSLPGDLTANDIFSIFNLWQAGGDVTVSGSSVYGTDVEMIGHNVMLTNASVSADDVFMVAKDSIRLDNSSVFASIEMLAVAGTAIKLENTSSISVSSPLTLNFGFPYLSTGGWFVDGVEGSFGAIDQFGYCLSGSSCISVNYGSPLLNQNFFVFYGGGQSFQGVITQSLYNPDDTTQLALQETDEDDDEEGSNNQDQPRECG